MIIKKGRMREKILLILIRLLVELSILIEIYILIVSLMHLFKNKINKQIEF
jgi:hypothetical protein